MISAFARKPRSNTKFFTTGGQRAEPGPGVLGEQLALPLDAIRACGTPRPRDLERDQLAVRVALLDQPVREHLSRTMFAFGLGPDFCVESLAVLRDRDGTRLDPDRRAEPRAR